MADKSRLDSCLSDYKCPICLELLIEPVVMPCEHELCRPCFRHNVEEANFVCPICRKRISSWARKCNREGTLVNQKRWSLIQKLFPEKCLKRLKGEPDESDDELFRGPPKRLLAESGELRQEYEKEMKKILEEKEKELKASEDLIKNMLEEEQALQLQQENQQRDDEQLAKQIAEELRKQVENDGEGPSRTTLSTSVTSTEKNKGMKKKRKMVGNGKSPQMSYTLDKYFSPKGKEPNCVADSDCISNKKHIMDEDFELAKVLQKQYDEEAIACRKRDEYMLRKTIDGENDLHRKETNNQLL